MNYTVIGNDGKSYGPISAEQVRQWIKQGRVESRTPVFVEGAADWTFIGLRPEFAAEFPENPPPIMPPKTGQSAGATVPVRTNSLATWGLACGILGWTCCGCCAPFDILGLTFSIIALVQINSAATPMEGRGFAIAGIVLSGSNLLWSFGMMAMGFLNDPGQLQWHLGN